MKKLIGKIISDKMQNTKTVGIDIKKHHPIYKRSFIVTTKIKAHDAKNEFVLGDMVEIIETRPISKDKSWKISRKIT